MVSHRLSSIIASPHLASSKGDGLDLLKSSVFQIIVNSSKVHYLIPLTLMEMLLKDLFVPKFQ